MTDQNSSWGAPTQNQNHSNPGNPASWGANVEGYGSGFATVLKIFVFIWSFVFPLFFWGIIAMAFADQTDGASIVIAIIGYPSTAFVLWVTSSYFVKLFDNISRIARNTEVILIGLQADMEGRKNDNH